jgi:CheY-like chemotaxis protein
VRLPLAPQDVAHPDGEARAPSAGGPRRRILVVDDNHDAARSLALLLESSGHRISVASDGEEALTAAEAFRPEIVLLDIGLPKLSGYEVCRRLRTLPWARSAAIIALSGWGQEEDRRQSKAAGFDVHLLKPVNPARLEQLLSELTAKSA